jgi:hypothetical protein
MGDEDQRLNVPRKLLSPKAKEGSWLTLDIVGGQPHNLKLDEKETDLAHQRHESRQHHDAIREKTLRVCCFDGSCRRNTLAATAPVSAALTISSVINPVSRGGTSRGGLTPPSAVSAST